MARLGLEQHIVDRGSYDRTVARFRDARITLPTFAQLADPAVIPAVTLDAVARVDPDTPDPLNLYRVHWFNDADRRGLAEIPAHVVLPPELTGVSAQIVVALGNRFPLIHAHKVLAAYGCLVPRLVTGQFDPSEHKALWPSTGNYCRGGVAISRILGCRGVAILPEGMSAERFDWLEQWVADPADVIRTPGSESNVKEIYDKCAELDADPQNVVFNQFCEFGNHLVHRLCTGRALEQIWNDLNREGELELHAFVAATGSAGTLGAGDALKERFGAKIVAVEAAECPTMLRNGFGEHNIQGIGDKHIPLIHNVMNTDMVVAISDAATDGLFVLFNTDEGRNYLATRRRVPQALVDQLPVFGLSGICNILAAIAAARAWDLGPADAIMTVATDGAELYATEVDKIMLNRFSGVFEQLDAAEVFAQHILGAGTGEVLELSHADRTRIFNLGYFTWVEQQGLGLGEFEARRSASFWRDLTELVPAWDAMIEEFNGRTGATGSA